MRNAIEAFLRINLCLASVEVAGMAWPAFQHLKSRHSHQGRECGGREMEEVQSHRKGIAIGLARQKIQIGDFDGEQASWSQEFIAPHEDRKGIAHMLEDMTHRRPIKRIVREAKIKNFAHLHGNAVFLPACLRYHRRKLKTADLPAGLHGLVKKIAVPRANVEKPHARATLPATHILEAFLPECLDLFGPVS